MTNTILVKGEEIIRTVLLCIAGITPRVNVDVFGDVFIALNAKYPAEFIVWMKILEAQSFPTTFIGHEEKVTFMKNIIKYVQSKLFMLCSVSNKLSSTGKKSTNAWSTITSKDFLQNVAV